MTIVNRIPRLLEPTAFPFSMILLGGDVFRRTLAAKQIRREEL
jgi:hypothetical protein